MSPVDDDCKRPAKMEEVLCVGLGAIGSFYALIFHLSRLVNVSAIARSNYEPVKDNGLSVKSIRLGEHQVPFADLFPAASTSRPLAGSTRRFSYVVVTTKALPDARPSPAEMLEPFVTETDEEAGEEGTTIVVIQNGVGNEDPYRQRWPKNPIITCVTWALAVQTSHNVVEHRNEEAMEIGLLPVDAAHFSPTALEQSCLDRFSKLLTAGGTHFTVLEPQAMQAKRWEKTAWNAAWNGITAVTQSPTGYYFAASAPHSIDVALAIMAEVVAVARALGLPLDEALPERLYRRARAQEKVVGPAGLMSSMMEDVKRGRETEVEVIHGNVLRKAKALGISTPVLQTIYTLVKAIDDRNKREKAHPAAGNL